VQPEEAKEIHRLSFDEAYSYLTCLPPKLGSYPYFELLAAHLGNPVFIEIDKQLRGKEKEDAYVYESLQHAIRCLQKCGIPAQDKTANEVLAVKLLRVVSAHSYRKGYRKQMAWLIIYSWEHDAPCEHGGRYLNDEELRETGISISPKVLNGLARYFGLKRPKAKQEGHGQKEDGYPVFSITRQSLEVAKLSLLESILPKLAWPRSDPSVSHTSFWIDSPLNEIEEMRTQAFLTPPFNEEQKENLQRDINEEIRAAYGKRPFFKVYFVKKPGWAKSKFRISARFNPRAYLSFLAQEMKAKKTLWERYTVLDHYWSRMRETFAFHRGSIDFSITIDQYERHDIDHALKDAEKISDWITRMAKNSRKAQLYVMGPIPVRSLQKESDLEIMALPIFSSSHKENLSTVKCMISSGHFTEAYVEMRRLLENLSWDVLNDLLILSAPSEDLMLRPSPRETELEKPSENEENFLIPAWKRLVFRSPSLEWYSATSRSRCNPSEFLSAFREKQKGNEGKRGDDIDVAAPLEYPTVLAGLIANTKIDEKDQKKSCDPSKFSRVPCVDLAQLLGKLQLIKNRLQESSNGNSVDELNALISRINKLKRDAEKLGVKGVVPPFPTQDLVIRLVEKLSGAKGLYEEYENLSSFVHSYGVTRSPYPFCSIYEIKVMRTEMDKFADMIGDVAESYVKYCDEFAKNSNRQVRGTES